MNQSLANLFVINKVLILTVESFIFLYIKERWSGMGICYCCDVKTREESVTATSLPLSCRPKGVGKQKLERLNQCGRWKQMCSSKQLPVLRVTEWIFEMQI